MRISLAGWTIVLRVAEVSRLRRAQLDGAGITRVRRGRGFSYLDRQGHPLTDPETIERIRSLAIPPAWTDVWICPDPGGHIQALGIDAAGRRQYRYHDDWRSRRDAEKFRRLEAFAEHLPSMRASCDEALSDPGVSRVRVLAGALLLLDRALFRVGTEAYTRANGSYGLATLRKDHLRLRTGRAVFDFTAKSGKSWTVEIEDPRLLKLLKQLKRRRSGGGELLAYRDDRGWRDVTSADINTFVREIVGEDFSAKDFRTWNATVLAALAVARHQADGVDRSSFRRVEASVAREVAENLGNTPAVSRSSYIDPRVFDRFREGITILPAIDRPDVALDGNDRLRARVESAVLRLLRGEQFTRAAA